MLKLKFLNITQSNDVLVFSSSSDDQRFISDMQMTPPLGQKAVALGVRIYILKFNSLLKVDAE